MAAKKTYLISFEEEDFEGFIYRLIDKAIKNNSSLLSNRNDKNKEATRVNG
ncbi:hypothetical protein [Ekhidna sp.]|uniref:hypothetical protein n=1 Tax=Ekhidna sp. TaxID=2608089 RepID=UPI003B5C42CF